MPDGMRGRILAMMADSPRQPRHIRFQREDRKAGERPPLQFQDRIHLPRVGRTTPLLLVLAALVVLVGLVGSAYLQSAGEAPTVCEWGPPGAVPFGPLSPSGEADRGLLIFSWCEHPEAQGYEVRLRDAADRTVWTARVARDTRVAMPEDVSRTLVRGGAYVWTVVAVLPGDRREESRALAFVAR